MTIRRALVLSLAALIAWGSVMAADSESVEQVLTLDSSVQRALQNNQEILSIVEEIGIAEQRIREARSQYFPKAGLNFNGSHYRAEDSYVLPPDFGFTFLRPSLNAAGGVETDNFYAFRALMRQPLYSGGRTRNTVRLAEADLKRARIRRDEARGKVIFQSQKVFYDVLLRKKEIGFYEELLSQWDRWMSSVPEKAGDARREMGAIQRRLRRRLSEKRLEEKRDRLQYLSVLGLELYSRVGLRGELRTDPVEKDLAKLLAVAQESRAEIRRTDYQKEVDQLAVNLSQSARYPVVELGAGYEFSGMDFPLDTANWNATLNMSVPIFDGFSSRARIRQKRKQASQGRIHRAEIEDRINLEVRQAYADTMFWQKELEVRQEDMKRAQSEFNSLRDNRQPEKARSGEWLLDAELAYWQAVHGHLVALAQLEKAVGRSLDENGTNP